MDSRTISTGPAPQVPATRPTPKPGPTGSRVRRMLAMILVAVTLAVAITPISDLAKTASLEVADATADTPLSPLTGTIADAASEVSDLVSPDAAAHYVHQRRWVYRSGALCVLGRAEISHGSGGGYAKVTANNYERSEVTGQECAGTNIYSRYTTYVRAQLWKYDGNNWSLCRDSDWILGRSYSINYGNNAPCGKGLYGVTGYAYTWNNGWRGGQIEAGTHWLR